MKPFLLRLPDNLHKRLGRLAKNERRSMNAQILWLLEQGLKNEGPKSA